LGRCWRRRISHGCAPILGQTATNTTTTTTTTTTNGSTTRQSIPASETTTHSSAPPRSSACQPSIPIASKFPVQRPPRLAPRKPAASAALLPAVVYARAGAPLLATTPALSTAADLEPGPARPTSALAPVRLGAPGRPPRPRIARDKAAACLSPIVSGCMPHPLLLRVPSDTVTSRCGRRP
jgi:hypothetical protein